MKRELFKFESSRGLTIKGVLFAPETKPLSPAVLYLPGAVLGSTAVHRLGIDLACRLADEGHPTCLFDPSGVGESEGDYPAGRHQELSIWVEAGSFVEDTVETIAFLSNRFGLSDFVLVGHCGGALTASYVAAGNRAVRGMFLISPPTVLIGARHEMDRAGIAEPYLKLYTSKVLSPEAWRRLLSGQSSYRTIARLVTTQIKRKIGSLLGLSATALVVAAAERMPRPNRAKTRAKTRRGPDVPRRSLARSIAACWSPCRPRTRKARPSRSCSAIAIPKCRTFAPSGNSTCRPKWRRASSTKRLTASSPRVALRYCSPRWSPS